MQPLTLFRPPPKKEIDRKVNGMKTIGLAALIAFTCIAGCSSNETTIIVEDDGGSSDNSSIDSGTNEETSLVDGSSPLVDGGAATDVVIADNIADNYVADVYLADAYVAVDAYVVDAYVADTFVADNYVADTFVADTYVADTYVNPVCQLVGNTEYVAGACTYITHNSSSGIMTTNEKLTTPGCPDYAVSTIINCATGACTSYTSSTFSYPGYNGLTCTYSYTAFEVCGTCYTNYSYTECCN
jgi:hypothetical protein